MSAVSKSSRLRLAVSGAGGRMGSAVIALLDAPEFQDFELVGAHLRADDALKSFARAQVIIDFAPPDAVLRHSTLAAQVPAAYVLGTTGLGDEQMKALKRASYHVPVLWAENFSPGVLALGELAKTAGRLLGDQFDIDIIESHHRHKKDAPSGTGLALLKTMEDASKLTSMKQPASGTARSSLKRGIAVSSLRQGGVIGEHSVVFTSGEEQIELRHRALSRDLFAAAALRSARILYSCSPGLYDLKKLLELAK